MSPCRMELATYVRIEGLPRGKYGDFGPALATETSLEREGAAVSLETIRRIQIEMNFWKPKAVRHKRKFQPRERRPRYGEMIQIDASAHDWLRMRAATCTLILFIHVATSRLTSLLLALAETTEAYLRALKPHIPTHGLPPAQYPDK